MPIAIELDEEGEALWRQLQGAWDVDQAKHDRFVQHCFATGRLAAAGGRYQAFLDDHLGDPIASRMQQRVIFLSTQALMAASSHRATAPRRFPLLASPWFVVVVLCGAVIGALVGIVYGGGR